MYPEIKRLREEEGLTFREIGERLEMPLRTAYDYYRDPDRAKAREGDQKRRAQGRSWAQRHPERQRELQRECYHRGPEKALERTKDWNRRNRSRKNATSQAWRERNKHRWAAQQAVRFMVLAGALERGPCEHAGPDCRGDIQAHHEDYSKPLDVRWLCAHHHRAAHGQVTRGNTAPEALVLP